MCYSYKGGSGRTVAAGNIAAALAKQGKKVLILDMDIEAPGLQNLFEITDTIKYKKRLGLQDYLKNHMTLEELDESALLDFSRAEDVGNPLPIPEDGKLLYLITTNRSTNILTEMSRIPQRMDDLVEYFGRKYDLDYIILDAASGIREAFTIALHITDILLVFFRWTRQHLEGTIKIGQLIDVMQGMGDMNRLKDFKLIASISPPDEELERLDNQVLSNVLSRIKEDSLLKLREELEDDIALFYEIPEIIELKWRERILAFDQKKTPYEEIVVKLMDD